jgi:hypothetical protein
MTGVVLADFGKRRFAGSQRFRTCRRTAIQEYQETIDLIVLLSHWCGPQPANQRRPTCYLSRLALICASHLQAWEVRDATLDAAKVLEKLSNRMRNVTPPGSLGSFRLGISFYVPKPPTRSPDLLGCTCRVSLGVIHLQLPHETLNLAILQREDGESVSENGRQESPSRCRESG